MGRPVEVFDEQIVLAGEAILAEGRAVTPTRLWVRLGKRGRPDRMFPIWLSHSTPGPARPASLAGPALLPEAAARLATELKSQLNAGVDRSVAAFHEEVQTTSLNRYQAELAAMAEARERYDSEMSEVLKALGDLSEEHELIMARVHPLERTLFSVQADLDAERVLRAQTKEANAALLARVDALQAEIHATEAITRNAYAERARAETRAEFAEKCASELRAEHQAARTDILNLEREIGSLRQSGKTLAAELDRQAVECRDTKAELGLTREKYVEQVARAASAESALRSLEWRVIGTQGETAVIPAACRVDSNVSSSGLG